MGMSTRRAVGTAAAVWLLAASGLAAAADRNDTVILAEVFGLRAGFALETDDAQVLTKAGCLEMLTRVGFDGTLEPGLATSWVQSAPDAWDFKLRPDVMFADGRKLDAAAVVNALNHTLHVAAPARAFSPRLVSAVTAVDDQTVRVTTPTSSVLVPLRMASPNTGILSPAAFQGDRIDPVKACTGPFTVVEDVPRQKLKLERNPRYWGGPVGYGRAELRYVPDGQVRATMAQTGEAQIATVLPVAVLRTAPPTIEVLRAALPRTTSLYLNTAKKPFGDVRVRQAIQAAIDTGTIAATVFEGMAAPAVGPFAPAEKWAPHGAKPVAPDAKKARDLLAQAGIGPNTLKMQIWAYPERPELPDLAAVLQAELGEVGIDATVKVASYSSFEPDLLAGKFDAVLLSRSHLTDVPDPGAFLTADYTCKGGYNLSHFCDPALDAKLAEAVAFTEPAKRFEAYQSIAEMLQQQAVSIFLVHEQQRDAVSKSVRNYRIHPLGHYMLTKDLTPAQ